MCVCVCVCIYIYIKFSKECTKVLRLKSLRTIALSYLFLGLETPSQNKCLKNASQQHCEKRMQCEAGSGRAWGILKLFFPVCLTFWLFPDFSFSFNNESPAATTEARMPSAHVLLQGEKAPTQQRRHSAAKNNP